MVLQEKWAYNTWLLASDVDDRKYNAHCCKEIEKAVLMQKIRHGMVNVGT